MARFLTRLVRRFYGLPQPEIKQCDLIVPLGYGLTVHNTLPGAEINVLREAVHLAKRYEARVAWASSKYFFHGSKDEEDKRKLSLLAEYGITNPLIARGITNSVTEAREIRAAVLRRGIKPHTIVVVLNWPHARSARLIWKETFPDANILMYSVEGEWNRYHRATLQRSNGLWLFACILRDLTLRIKGLEWVAQRQHPAD